MKRIAVTQRVQVIAEYGERRDALDQRWTGLLDAACLLGIPVPNTLVDPESWLTELSVDGVLLTGGNDLAACGGDAPERDRLEAKLIDWAIANDKPLLGVCRGMQMIQHHFGVKLQPVDGHVATEHGITLEGEPVQVNSYHAWGATDTVAGLLVIGRAEDGVIEAVEHRDHRLRGIMWHPERRAPFSDADLVLLRTTFGSDA